MLEKHFVQFLSPGTFVAESTEKPVESWDVDQAVRMASEIIERHGATPYGFRFLTRRREDDELDSKVVKTSGVYYLEGIVETIEQIREKMPNSVLLQNMEANGFDRVVTSTNGYRWTQPLYDNDLVLSTPVEGADSE